MPKVNAPDGKVINFPETMGMEDINSEMSKMYPAPKTSPPSPIPGPSNYTADPHWQEPNWAGEDALGPMIGAVGKAWHAINTPVADFGGHPGRTQDLLTRGMALGTGTEQAEKRISGIPSSKSLFRNKPTGPKEAYARTALEGFFLGKDASVAKTGAEMFATPLGIATLGSSSLLSKLGVAETAAIQTMNTSNDTLQALRRAGASTEVLTRAAQELNSARKAAQTAATLHRSARAVEMSAAAGFGGGGAEQAYESAKEGNVPQAMSGAGQALLGGAGVFHGGGGVADVREHFNRAEQSLRDAHTFLRQTETPHRIDTPSGIQSTDRINTPATIHTPERINRPFSVQTPSEVRGSVTVRHEGGTYHPPKTPVPPEASAQDRLLEETRKSMAPSKPTEASQGPNPVTDPTSQWRKRLAEHKSGQHPFTKDELATWQKIYQDTQAASVMGARPWDTPETPFNIDLNEKTQSTLSPKTPASGATEESSKTPTSPEKTGRSTQAPTENDQILEGKGDVPPLKLEENLVPLKDRASSVIPREAQADLMAKMEGRDSAKEELEKNAPLGQALKAQVSSSPDNDFFAQAKKELPNGDFRDWSRRAVELREQSAQTGFGVGDNVYWGPNKVSITDKLEDGSYKITTKEGRTETVDGKVLSKDPDLNQAGILRWGTKGTPAPQQYGSKGVISRVLDAVTEDRRSPEEQGARNVLREMGGKRQRTIDQLYAEFGKAASEHDSDTVQDLIDFNNYGERKPGASPISPKDALLADRLTQIQKEIWDELHQLNPDKFDKGIENYLGRLFKGSNGKNVVDRVMFTKRPMEGGKGWMRGRVWDWIDDSIAAGGEPVTNNPIRMQLLSIYQHMKYLTAHRVLAELKETGSVRFHEIGDSPNDGFTRIDDSIFEPRQMTKEGLIEHGNYWAHPDVAKIFNTQFQPGLRQFQIYNTLRSIGDFQNQMQLGFSAYHATFSTISGAMASDFALGLERIFNEGKVLPGIRSMVNSIREFNPFDSKNTYHVGSMMEQAWLSGDPNHPLAGVAKLYEQAGGRLGSGLQYDKYSGESVVPIKAIGRELKGLFVNGKYWEGIKRTPLAVSEGASRWLMRYYVPRLKMGVFARMASDKYDSMLKDGASAGEIQTAMGKIADSVDNRMGQVIYDNRFIHRIGKDLAQLGVRSVGWNWGTIGELGGGVKDIATEGIKAVRGQRAELTHRAAYVMGMTMVSGALGATMNYAMTGQAPKEAIDYFFPRTGNLDAQGNPERVSLPTYMKDVFSYHESVSKTLMHKLHPMWSTLGEMYQNENYYGQEIETPGASWGQHKVQDAKYLLGQFAPISLKAAQQRISTGAGSVGSVIASELGVTPAPRYIGQTKAEKLAYELSNRHQSRGPHDEASTTQRENYVRIRNQYTQGKLSEQQLMEEFNKGTISASQYDKLGEEKDMPSLVRHVHALYPREALSVWQNSNDQEKALIKDEMYRQYDLIDDRKDPDLLKDYDKIFFKSKP